MNPSRKAVWWAYWTLPSLLCLLIYWRGFTAWFRADDFAWLGLTLRLHTFQDLLETLFLPAAQGTFRPWSERAFFMAGFSLFGLDVLPFRIVIFATQFANLALVAAIGSRLTGRRAAGFCAAIFWVLNGSLIEPLGWVCVYNQVMCAFFLLLAFYFLLRSIEAEAVANPRLAKRFEIFQWITFLAGFGAQELNMVYPVLAAGYTLLRARPRFRRTLPMFAVSIIYVLGHNRLAPIQKTGDYGMHFTGAIWRVLGKYWTWSVGPVFLRTPLQMPEWVVPTGVAIVSAGLLVFLVSKIRAGATVALFCIGWYLVTIAPVLPLRDHMTEYYVYIPLIGLCWLGGWAFAEAWAGIGQQGRKSRAFHRRRGAEFQPAMPAFMRASPLGQDMPPRMAAWQAESPLHARAERPSQQTRIAATAVALLYAFLVVPRAVAGAEWNYGITMRARDLVEGVASAHELHPDKTILLDGVDTVLFWNAFLDHPFKVLGIANVYLAPGSEQHIDANPNEGDITEFVLPPDVVTKALEHGEMVVYDVRGPRLRNITSAYRVLPREVKAPQRVDVGSPLTAYLLGPEWYSNDGEHRWMPRHASVRIGGPTTPGQKLYLHGYCAPEQLRDGPVLVTVSVDGSALPSTSIPPGDNTFDLSFPLPAATLGKPEMKVEVEVSRTFRPPSDARDLGLAFGAFEVR